MKPVINLDRVVHSALVRAWCSLGYLFPGLHPDEVDNPDGGWPPALRRFAVEAWTRAESGELSDAELYPCDAQWSGICDRIPKHNRTELEMQRRLELVAEFGPSADA